MTDKEKLQLITKITDVVSINFVDLPAESLSLLMEITRVIISFENYDDAE